MEPVKGLHNRQEYTPDHGPKVKYVFETNGTGYWIWLNNVEIARGRFEMIDGKYPGSLYLYNRAVDVIESFYEHEHETVHDHIPGATSFVFYDAWHTQINLPSNPSVTTMVN